MRINPDDLRRHYASLPDGALLAIDRDELTDLAKAVYDEERAKRKLKSGHESPIDFDEDADQPEEVGEPNAAAGIDSGPEPDWLEEATCACTFTVRNPNTSDAAADACSALRAARIPCHVTVTQEEPAQADPTPLYSVRVMVPVPDALHAMSVLDHDMFNEEQEAYWRNSLEMLSDDEILALDPEVLCAGLLDRVARLRRAYADELARRNLSPG